MTIDVEMLQAQYELLKKWNKEGLTVDEQDTADDLAMFLCCVVDALSHEPEIILRRGNVDSNR